MLHSTLQQIAFGLYHVSIAAIGFIIVRQYLSDVSYVPPASGVPKSYFHPPSNNTYVMIFPPILRRIISWPAVT